MPKGRDATWKRLQSWLRISKKFDLRRGTTESFTDEIDRACEAFGLDTSQKSKDLLLGIFADIYFPPSMPSPRRALVGEPKQPRKKAWTAERIARLNDQVAQIQGASQRTGLPVTQTMMAELLQHFWPQWWGKIDNDTLKRKIRAYACGYNSGTPKTSEKSD